MLPRPPSPVHERSVRETESRADAADAGVASAHASPQQHFRPFWNTSTTSGNHQRLASIFICKSSKAILYALSSAVYFHRDQPT